MTENSQATATLAQANSTDMRAAIAQKWSKFTDQDVSALKNEDDFVTQVQFRYQLDRVQAQKDVDAFFRGRQL
jgi:hypothetical protein